MKGNKMKHIGFFFLGIVGAIVMVIFGPFYLLHKIGKLYYKTLKKKNHERTEERLEDNTKQETDKKIGQGRIH